MIWNLFANHWSRDSVGALEIPLEAEEDEFGLSVAEYNSLSSAYFGFSMPVPILAGLLSQAYGPAETLVFFALCAFAGNARMHVAFHPLADLGMHVCQPYFSPEAVHRVAH